MPPDPNPSTTRPSLFRWFHRDEIQIVAVQVFLIIFFSRSPGLTRTLIALILVVILAQNALRWLMRGHRTWAGERGLSRFDRILPHFPWDRSRLVFAALSSAIVGSLFVYRHLLWIAGGEHGTPEDRYWALFLAWYFAVCMIILVYLCYVWNRERATHIRPHILFWEGLVGSMFFYHGLPQRARIVTLAAAFLLGGLPSFAATQIVPDDPGGIFKANLLLFPVALLTIGGALYTMRWLEAFEERLERLAQN